jgi:hypothetical protein
MADYARTAIRRLAVRGYRSLRSLELQDLPDLIVLYGPNGSGKSNLMKAARLLLRAAALSSPVPRTRDGATVLSLAEANEKLELRPDDFTHGRLPEIRISLEISLGDKARAVLAAPGDTPLNRLDLEAVFQDTGDKTIRFWFERADIDGRIELPGKASQEVTDLEAMERFYTEQRVRAKELRQIIRALGGASSDLALEKETELAVLESRMPALRKQITQEKERLSQKALLDDRAQRALIPSLMQVSGAYRAPGGAEDPSGALYAAFLSEDPRVREAALSLGRRLAEAGLFGPGLSSIEMIPVEAVTFKEKQVRFNHPLHGMLPLRNLGTGQQQVVLMLAQRVITPYPIACLEEPEAHLYKTLMETLARVLQASVAGVAGVPDVDQLWIATHHHYFALADHFFEVRLDGDGATQVEKKRRDEAIAHFFEPSPYWDTLELLVKEGMSPDAVVYRDAEGNPATAGDVLASLRGDRILARRFVDAATKAFVLSLVQEEPEK